MHVHHGLNDSNAIVGFVIWEWMLKKDTEYWVWCVECLELQIRPHANQDFINLLKYGKTFLVCSFPKKMLDSNIVGDWDPDPDPLVRGTDPAPDPDFSFLINVLSGVK